MNKKLIYPILIMTMLGTLLGCATTAKYKSKVDYWKGKNINKLIEVW
jgi:hypothetical protein